MIRYMYIRNEKDFPVACVAYTINNGTVGSNVKFGVSTYNPNDKFDKRMARLVAAARITEFPRCIGIRSGERYVNIEHAIKNHLLADGGIPNRLRKLLERNRW